MNSGDRERAFHLKKKKEKRKKERKEKRKGDAGDRSAIEINKILRKELTKGEGGRREWARAFETAKLLCNANLKRHGYQAYDPINPMNASRRQQGVSGRREEGGVVSTNRARWNKTILLFSTACNGESRRTHTRNTRRSIEWNGKKKKKKKKAGEIGMQISKRRE